ncbi:MAG: 16S rRNA (uracil(1498)-N(3))-methyltransferase [Deltaproteobacteria bacterium]|nr:16S rRNA (uracil(1498)-N(3))-methyltransferase [Deltaproteobacteria bacterium]
MTTPRIFSPQPLCEQQLYSLGEEHQHYLRHVLRIRIGDAVTLFDGSGSDYQGVVERLDAQDLAVRIINRAAIAGKTCRLTLAQALPKGSKMDDIVEKATELGVDRIIPFRSSRSVPKWSVEKAADRVVRWRKIAIEAARRCRRPDIPPIEGVVTYVDMLRMARQDDIAASSPPWPGSGPVAKCPAPVGVRDDASYRIIFWEEGGRSVKSILHGENGRQADHLFLVIGPEGGFSREEIDSARDLGFVVAGLGAQVLRVETASLVVLAILQYELGIFSMNDDGKSYDIRGVKI